jgi:hypothetical protein
MPVVAGETVLLYVLVAAVGFLIYKVNRLERMVESGARVRRQKPAVGDSKLIPILKDEIEPGPFAQGNRRQQQNPPESEE